MNRRDFIQAAGLAVGGSALNGCRHLLVPGGEPVLRFGVISDIHIQTPASTGRFRRALRYFDGRRADAVMVAGDLSDWGLKSGFKYVADAWNSVFPGDRAADGRPVRKLFVTGNHDFDGWWYGDMTLDMHLNGYSEDEALSRIGMGKCWEEAFGEPYSMIRKRMVRDVCFVSAEWEGTDASDNDAAIAKWFENHAAEFPPDKPFFFFRHAPLANTVSSSAGRKVSPVLTDCLRRFPNCIAFNGHTHWTLNDERSIWQEEFTAVSIPSLEYTSVPYGYENGRDGRRAESKLGMMELPSRVERREAQGFLASLYEDRLVLERWDFDEMVEAASPWIVPLGRGREKPYAFETHAAVTAVPQFPAGADVSTRIVNADRRNGRWTIFVELGFPAAECRRGRVFDYRVAVQFEDGRVAAEKKYLSPAFYRLKRDEPPRLAFRFDGMDIPESGKYRFAVYPRNCFGGAGDPIYSRWFESKPGKDMTKYRKWS